MSITIIFGLLMLHMGAMAVFTYFTIQRQNDADARFVRWRDSLSADLLEVRQGAERRHNYSYDCKSYEVGVGDGFTRLRVNHDGGYTEVKLTGDDALHLSAALATKHVPVAAGVVPR